MKISGWVSFACAVSLSMLSFLPAQSQTQNGKEHTGDLAGVWYPSSVDTFNFIWSDSQGKRLTALPLTPWGEERIKGNHPIGGAYTALTSNDPNFSCLPPGVPNIYTHAYPIEFIQTPGRTIMFFEYGHFVRQIFTDGRKHAEDANPTWLGDSIGHWEGDTLVADSTGFNDKTWLDVTGHPHSEALHLVERFRRVDHNTLMVDISVDDPRAYTAPLKTSRKYILKPDWNIMEYICEDNRVSFLDFEKKVGAKGDKAAETAGQQGNLQSIAGDWKGTATLADGRSVPAAASFVEGSTGTITLADPTEAVKYQLLNLLLAPDGTITAHAPDGTNLIAKLSQDGKQITGDVILASGTGHKISLGRP